MCSNPWVDVQLDSGGISTIVVNESHLQNFPTFMHHVLRSQIGLDKGVFKVRFTEDTPRSTTFTDLLTFLRNYFLHEQVCGDTAVDTCQLPLVVDRQVFFHGHCSENVYGLLKSDEDVKIEAARIKTFVKRYLHPSVLDASVCLECRDSLDHSPDALQDHYWSKIRQVSQVSSGMELSHDQINVASVLEAAQPLRKKFCPSLSDNHQERLCSNPEDPTVEPPQENEAKPKRSGQKLKQKIAPPILYCSGLPLALEEFRITPNFSLSKLGTLLDVYPNKCPGISFPYLYIGTSHASFAYHIEDAALFSINYLHFGAPCVWFFVPPHYFKKFSDWSRLFFLDLNVVSCSNLIGSGHKYVMASSQFLKKLGIPVHMVVQREGELIITYPFVAHSGFKCGFNIQQSVNFADEWWIEAGLLAPKCLCEPHLLDMDFTEMLAVCRPSLAVKYINRDFLGIYSSLAKNEFVQRLGLLPSPIPPSEPGISQVNPCDAVFIEDVPGVGMEPEVLEVQEIGRSKKIPTSRGALLCPEPGCGKSFEGGRAKISRLKNHMTCNHQATPEKLNQLDIMYPKKNIFKTKRLVCDWCGEMKAGGNTAMKLHKTRCRKQQGI